jgi:Flp pilus assembly protein TadG
LGRFWRNSAGGISLMYAIVLPALIGFVGLGVETGLWYVEKRALQTQADAASLGGVWELAWKREDQVTSSATNEAVRNHFPNNPAFTTITVNNPPTSGSEAGNDKAVEVNVTQDFDPMFASMFLGNKVTIAARAVSTLVVSGEACVLALNGTVSDAAESTGSTNINAPDCTIAANSNASDAISFSGNADITFKSAWSTGGIDGWPNGETNADVTLLDGAQEKMWPIDDPYADLPDTAPNGCEKNNQYQNINGAVSITASGGAETICGNITIHNGANVNFAPGTYWMKGGSLTINGGTVTCSACTPGGQGVTFIFTTPSNGNVNQIGTVQINGNATVTLNAPGTGTYKGVLFFQDRDTPMQTNKSAILNGGANTVLNGAIYFPKNEVQWAGNNSLAATCTLIIGDTVTFTGDSGLSVANCKDQGVDISFIQKISLVE